MVNDLMVNDNKQQPNNDKQQDRFVIEADEAIEYYSPSGGRKLLWTIVIFFIARL